MAKRWKIHLWAVGSAATAAALPFPADAACLFGEEALMVVHVASMFGQSINKKTAEQALETGALGCVVGLGAAVAVFETFDLAYPASIGAKAAVATGVMEALGNATFNFYKNGGRL